MKRFLLAATSVAVLSMPVAAQATTYISDDPTSMYYDETWDAYYDLAKAFAEPDMWQIFPQCKDWLWWNVTYMPPQPVIQPPVVWPPIDPPCVDCGPPPPCVDCSPPPCLDCNPPPPHMIPEPSTWALMLIGLASLGFVSLKRRFA